MTVFGAPVHGIVMMFHVKHVYMISCLYDTRFCRDGAALECSMAALDDISLSVYLNDGRFGVVVRCPILLVASVASMIGQYVGAGVCRVVIPAGEYQSGSRLLWTCTYEFEPGCSPGPMVDQLLQVAARRVGAVS